MQLSDEKLMLLEQLTYLDTKVSKAAGITSVKFKGTIEDVVSQFDENKLKKLEKAGSIGNTYTQGNEWAAVIRAIKADKDLKDLKITNAWVKKKGINKKNKKKEQEEKKTVALCFEDPKEPKKAIVAFRGTINGKEWNDNVEGLNRTDTKYQKEALHYIEGLPYSDITVVGHSKGGNKAQYVAIVSDKVNRCVSMDGQGFSGEFMNKYWAEIQKKSEIIKNYSLSNDYVHILLFPIPGAGQIFCKGNGMENGLENHSPNSYFHYYKDDNGNWMIKVDKKGNIYLSITSEDEIIAYLHGFVNFVMNVMPDDNKEKTIELLGVLLGVYMGGDGKLKIDEEVYLKSEMPQFIIEHQESLALVIAYLLKYADTYHLTEEKVFQLLRAFGLGTIADDLQTELGENHIFRTLVSSGENLLSCFLNQLKDGKEDKIIEFLLERLTILLKEKGFDFDAKAFWKMIEKEYAKIGDVDALTARANASVKSGKTFNFSKDAYEKLLSIISDFERIRFEDTDAWKAYSTEEWYEELFIRTASKGIRIYADRLTEMNSLCKTRIDTVFHNEWEIDSKHSSKIKSLRRNVTGAGKIYQQLAESLE